MSAKQGGAKLAGTDQISAMMGRFVGHQSSYKELSSADSQWASQNPKEAIALHIEAIKNRRISLDNDFFERIYGDEKFIIDACGGEDWVYDMPDGTMAKEIHDKFNYLEIIKPSQFTPEMTVGVGRLIKKGTIAQMFNSFQCNLSRLCFTEEQIIVFLKKYSKLIWEENAKLFFLLKLNEDEFVVVRLCKTDFGIDGHGFFPLVFVDQFNDEHEYGDYFKAYVVIPQA